MKNYERENYSPVSVNKHYEFYDFYSTNKIIQNKKIIKFYRTLFGLQITIILLYYIYNLCV